MTPIIETDRLILRPVTLDDAPAVQRYFNNWNIIQFIGAHVPWPYPDDGAVTHLKDCLEKMQGDHFYVWALTLKDKPDEAVGLIEYRFLPDKDDNRGFWLAKHLWGQGLMSEAVTTTQDYILLEKGYSSIVAKNAATNEASRAVKIKHGAEFLGVKEGHYHIEDQKEEAWRVTGAAWAKIRNVPLDSLPECPRGDLPRKDRPISSGPQ